MAVDIDDQRPKLACCGCGLRHTLLTADSCMVRVAAPEARRKTLLFQVHWVDIGADSQLQHRNAYLPPNSSEVLRSALRYGYERSGEYKTIVISVVLIAVCRCVDVLISCRDHGCIPVAGTVVFYCIRGPAGNQPGSSAELQRGSLLLQSLVKAGDDGAKRKIAPEYMRIFTLP